jgi:hypothetical protein
MRSISSKKPSTKIAAVPAPQAEPQAEPQVDPFAPVEVALEPNDAVIVQLASERLQNAQLHLQNRQNELNGLLGQVRTKYEENGKYAMSSIDLGKATIIRALRAE